MTELPLEAFMELRLIRDTWNLTMTYSSAEVERLINTVLEKYEITEPRLCRDVLNWVLFAKQNQFHLASKALPRQTISVNNSNHKYYFDDLEADAEKDRDAGVEEVEEDLLA